MDELNYVQQKGYVAEKEYIKTDKVEN
jgi:hypothetical protein